MDITNGTDFRLPLETLFCDCYPVATAPYVPREVDALAACVRCTRCGLTWQLVDLYQAEVRRGRGHWRLVS